MQRPLRRTVAIPVDFGVVVMSARQDICAFALSMPFVLSADIPLTLPRVFSAGASSALSLIVDAGGVAFSDRRLIAERNTM